MSNEPETTLAPLEAMPVAETADSPQHLDAMRHIAREGPGEGKAWRVSICRASSETIYQKEFVDGYYRSNKALALAAAQAWRDAMEMPPGQTSSQPPARGRPNRRAKNKASGMCGVNRIVFAKWRGEMLEQLTMQWVAVTPPWVVPRRQRSFSIFRFGEEAAYQLAVAARKKFEADATTPARKLCPPQLRHIQRVERKRFGIWYVSIASGPFGRVARRPFSDLLYGDKAQALAAAQAWRDEIEGLNSQPVCDDFPETIRAA